MNETIVPRVIRRVFQGRIFSVNVETVTLPRGKELAVEVVRHPGSVVIVPVDDSGRIVLVRQYRHALGRRVWELPAGSLGPGEDPARAAHRECQEETGLVASRVERVGSYFPTPGYCDEEMHFFVATGLRPPGREDPPVHVDDDEDIEIGTFGVAELRRMADAGEIIDLKTIAGLWLRDRRQQD